MEGPCSFTAGTIVATTVGDGQWVVHNACGPTNTSELDPNLPSQLTYEGTVSGAGRSGGNREPLGVPNSYVQTTGGHALVYDNQGRLIYDIDANRVKMVIWDQAPDGKFYQRDNKLDGPVPPDWHSLLP